MLGSTVSFPKYYLILIPSLFGRYFYYHLSFTNEDTVNGFSLSSRVCSEEQGGSQSWVTGIQTHVLDTTPSIFQYRYLIKNLKI